MAADAERVYREVQDYYGKELTKTKDLKTNACRTLARPLPAFVREALQCVHEEVSAKYYGCGLVIPECLENCWILDLGSGSGRDCYVLSKLVGKNGHVTGVDMTEAQVEVAKKHVAYHMNKFGYQKPNVSFIHGYMEKLGEAGLKDESYSIVISNCVVNLSPDKRAVLREAYRVLKEGGEMYFSDVYASHDLPEEIRKHRVLWGECLAGALWWKDLYKIAEEVGFWPPRLVTTSRITLANKEVESVVGDCQFVSATFRLFKIPKDVLPQQQEVIYKGGIVGHEKELEFDINYKFKQGEVVDVDEETAALLQNSRFASKFFIHPVRPTSDNSSPGKRKLAKGKRVRGACKWLYTLTGWHLILAVGGAVLLQEVREKSTQPKQQGKTTTLSSKQVPLCHQRLFL
ncbi:arsenite methyltransferase isoform X2 [Hemicordylus capensis]|uniref:arsenite methyltransferase isoform X2 n=1 Tax=Hemicordylus capensis TaxID=884348 RepID=UPI00230394E3|nr:arsenite methyltransferase isoform X2 [Hemicordylus capensis]